MSSDPRTHRGNGGCRVPLGDHICPVAFEEQGQRIAALEETIVRYESSLRASGDRHVWQESKSAVAAQRIAALQELGRRDGSQPIGVDISDYSDEWCSGFLAGQKNVLEALRAALGGKEQT